MGAPRRTVAGRPFTLLVLSMLMTTACVDDGTAADAAQRPFTRADVNLIVLGPNDAPDGTAYVEDGSGFHDLDAFARDDIERSHLVDDGFQVGHVALFLPPASVNGPSPEPLTNDSVIVQGITGLFSDAEGAESSLQRYVQDLRTRQIPDASGVPAEGLGDVSFGLRGETPDGSRVQIFVWRIGNLLLAISGSGPVTVEDVRTLADLIDGRT